ncbi:beta-1,3-galactosyltransferase 1-like isoform X2 [Branchiostoma floridae x Branchiostoma japonicum]
MVRISLKLVVKTIFILCIMVGSLYVFLRRRPNLRRPNLRRPKPPQQEPRDECERDDSSISNSTSNAEGNPHNYTLILNNPGKCDVTGGDDVFLLVMVTSTPGNHKQRLAIRNTWGNESNVKGTVIRTVFAVGLTQDAKMQGDLEQENGVYKDIIQEDFVESYRNLTLKTVMCLKWASEFCPNAKFVLKTDDDTFVNIFNLVRHLEGLNATQARRFVTGRVYTGAKPVRHAKNKQREVQWCLSKRAYPRDSFPPYPGGNAYVISNDITRLIYEVSLTVRYLFIEDVYLGLCLEKLGIDPVHEGGFVSWKDVHSCKDKKIASHWLKTPVAMVKAWKDLISSC